MKTISEILGILDAMQAKVHCMRMPRETWDKGEKGDWRACIEAERNGVSIKVDFQDGHTLDDALAKAFAKFEPAASGGLPQLAIADASFEVVPPATVDDVVF